MSKKKIEVQMEVCGSCNGTGRNFWLGPQKPHVKERLCSECWGVGKRPIQFDEAAPGPGIITASQEIPPIVGVDQSISEAVEQANDQTNGGI